MNTPLFLLGTQRCGTTLLTRMLSSHDGLFVQNEMGMGTIFKPPLSTELITKRIAGSMKSRYNVPINELDEKGVKWGWKDPLLTHHLDSLSEYFPHSKYILIVRDPRAVVASYIDNAWGLGTNAYTGALRWRAEVEKQLAFVEKHKENCYSVKYEVLLSDTQRVLQEICSHLDVPFQAKMLDYYKKPLEFKENKSNVNTQKPLNLNSLEKWKQVFSERQVGVINAVCRELMEKLGYSELAEINTVPGVIEETYYNMHQKIIGEIQLQYQLRKSRRLSKKNK